MYYLFDFQQQIVRLVILDSGVLLKVYSYLFSATPGRRQHQKLSLKLPGTKILEKPTPACLSSSDNAGL